MLSIDINHPERWAPVPGFEGLYEVSTLGSIRSVARTTTRSNGRPMNIVARVLKPYVRVRAVTPYAAIHMRNGPRAECNLVHVLVLRAFVGPRPAGHLGCHRDGDSLNNTLSNLYWGTPLENSADQRLHGTSPAGERNGRAKLTVEQVRIIKSSSERNVVLATQFNVEKRAIHCIKRGITWANV